MTIDLSTLPELQALRESYAADLPQRLDQIEAYWAQRHEPGALTNLHYQLHSLAGSGGTFGFVELSQVARQFEALLRKVLEGEQELEGRASSEAALLFKALRRASSQPDETSPEMPGQARRDMQDSQGIVLLDPDPVAADELAGQLEILGYRCRVARTEAQMRDLVIAHAPLAVLLDPADAYSFKPLFDGSGTSVPLVFLSSRDDFDSRLRSVRANGLAHFTKPADALAVATMLDELTLSNPQEAHRILIIEDDEPLARYYALTLQNAGMETQVVTNPMAVMKALHEFSPDLLLMDLYMPGCNGLELAAVIRQQRAFIGIPIVFLSSETDGDKQLAAMNRGGDDFLDKSIGPKRLAGLIAVRVSRARSMRALIASDGLTGLYNHSYIKEKLAQELARAARYNSPLAFAMLDIDKFKQVNDRHGHLTGDRVIKSLARHLRQRLRNSDVIGRYGGEEFAVILPATTAEVAAKVLDEIRATFCAQSHHTEQGDIVVSFSCGVADYPQYTDAETLNDAADKALYRAKQAGRNRVVISDQGIGADGET